MSNPWQRRAAISKLEMGGVPVTLPDYPEWTFNVRRRCAWNPAYHAAIARLSVRPDVAAMLERSRANPDAPMSDADKAIDQAMSLEAFAEGCIASWSGVTDEKGKSISHSINNVVRVLEAFPDIYAELVAVSGNPAKFKPVTAEAKAEAVAGN